MLAQLLQLSQKFDQAAEQSQSCQQSFEVKMRSQFDAFWLLGIGRMNSRDMVSTLLSNSLEVINIFLLLMKTTIVLSL